MCVVRGSSVYGVVTLFTLALLLVAVKGDDPHHNCVIKTMQHLGFEYNYSVYYEERALSHNISLDNFATMRVEDLMIKLNASVEDVVLIQECFRRKTPLCIDYKPCDNRGLCRMVRNRDWDLDYLCICPPLYHGEYCEHIRSGPLRDLRVIEAEIALMMRHTEERTKYMTRGCNLGTLGYTFNAGHSTDVDTDVGMITSVEYVKKLSLSYFKLTYTAGTMLGTANAYSRWYFKIDGKECSSPSNIDMVRYQNKAWKILIPSTMSGICASTDLRLGPIPSGKHNISVHVGGLGSLKAGDAKTGRLSMSLLEVEEVCPP
eukprot:scpid67428/ scgid4305/ 